MTLAAAALVTVPEAGVMSPNRSQVPLARRAVWKRRPLATATTCRSPPMETAESLVTPPSWLVCGPMSVKLSHEPVL